MSALLTVTLKDASKGTLLLKVSLTTLRIVRSYQAIVYMTTHSVPPSCFANWLTFTRINI